MGCPTATLWPVLSLCCTGAITPLPLTALLTRPAGSIPDGLVHSRTPAVVLQRKQQLLMFPKVWQMCGHVVTFCLESQSTHC
jgi:hypothetical protein